MKQILVLFLTGCLSLGLLTACGAEASSEEAPLPAGTVSIQLSDNGITVDGEKASSDDTDAVYVAHDIVFYLEGQGIAYGEGTEEDAHSQAEADAHTVVHISQPGTYVLSGTLSAGQVAVDLGEDAEEDPDAVVTLILNGVDITCSVAPAVIFYNVYECGSADAESAVKDVDTSAAGANVILADGTVNNIAGSYVARIYKPDSVELSEDGSEVVDSKKLHKYDGAFYSKMSMNVDGEAEGTGVLNIFAENEGLDSELHLTVNGGVINILSGNDGINTNEDGVSVTTVNGGTMTIEVDGATGAGDGIDSHGWLPPAVTAKMLASTLTWAFISTAVLWWPPATCMTALRTAVRTTRCFPLRNASRAGRPTPWRMWAACPSEPIRLPMISLIW